MGEVRLYDAAGNRLYLTQAERDDFLSCARLQRPIARTFAETLAFSGCRIPEALEIIPKRVELDERPLCFVHSRSAAQTSTGRSYPC